MDTDTLTISETAALLGRSKQFVWNCLVDGRLPHVTQPRCGHGRWAVSVADAVAFRSTLTETRGRKPTVHERLTKKINRILETT